MTFVRTNCRSYLMSYDYLMQGASLLPEPDVKTARVRLLKLLGLEEKPNYSEQEKIVDI